MFYRIGVLQQFLAVIEAGSIHKAAKAIHISQPALTRRIQALEEELGVQLFERTQRGMELTRYGEILRHHAQQIALSCTYAAEEIMEIAEGAAGELRVAAGPAWSYGIAPDAIARLRTEFPRVKVGFTSEMMHQSLPKLYDGKLDLVIGGLPPDAERNVELRYETLLNIDHCVFANREHPLQGHGPVTAKQLHPYPWIFFAQSVDARAALARFFRNAGLAPPEAAVSTNSYQSGIRLMRRGEFLMVLPSTLIDISHHQGVDILAVAGGIGTFAAGMIYRDSALRLKPFARFRQILKDLISAL